VRSRAVAILGFRRRSISEARAAPRRADPRGTAASR
jgi:hypothetical protein